MPTDKETIAKLELDLVQTKVQVIVAREDAEHAENELEEFKWELKEEKAKGITRDRLLDALKDARRAAGHSDTCSTVYRPAPPYDFCDCGYRNT